MIDLRSDTVTKPTPKMRQFMAKADVGDDVYGEDPTVNAFQEKISSMFGFEAGLFVPSGVMGNQISLNILTVPGDEVIIDETSHTYNYEITSAALISSIQLHPVWGKNGKLRASLVREAVRPGSEIDPFSRALVIENTTNKGGGACYTKKELQELRKAADNRHLKIHLDGARIWNAMEATGTEPEFFGEIADTMSVCFSKGLGAPAGSMILSTKENIKQARRIRKMLGGGMRQIGLLAAAADYAVTHHRYLLADDHRRTRELAQTIDHCSKLAISLESVETNILLFEPLESTPEEIARELEEKGILVSPFGAKKVRVTFHFQISNEELAIVQQTFEKLYG